MRIFGNNWRAGSLAVLLTLVGTCWQAQAQDHEGHASLWERAQLFGDWRGVRTRLAQRGIIVDLQSTQFYQGITSGGPPGKRGEWEYGGVGDAYITIVGDKFGWKGFLFSIHAETRFGDSINPFVGLAPPNHRLLMPPEDPPVIAVTNYSFIQQIGRGWAVSAGQFNMFDLWDQIYHGGKGVDKFMNASLILPLNFGRPISAVSIPGASILKTKGLEIEGVLAVLDTKDYSTKFGVEDLFDQGATIVGLWKFFHKIHGLPGYTSIVGMYNTREFNSIDPSGIIFIPGQGLQFAEVAGSWGVTGILSQKLWMDPANPKRNVELFAQLGIADDDPNPINWVGTVGLTASGVIPGREHDGFGVGYFYTGLSDNFKQLLNVINLPLRDLQGVEVYYKFGLTPWLAVTADLQVVQPSVKALDTDVIAGVRTKVTF
ncbi:MAG: carbohydrate porin [Hyphomicrobium sp.]